MAVDIGEQKNRKCVNNDNIHKLVEKRINECLENKYTPEQETEYLKVFNLYGYK